MQGRTKKELLDALVAMKNEPNKEHADDLTAILNDSVMLVPAVMPKDTDPAIIKQMMKNPKKPMPMPAGARPSPCILQNGQGERFFPMFTSEEEIEKGKNVQKYPITLNMPFKACIDIILGSGDIKGAVINPYSHNVIMNIGRGPGQADAGEKADDALDKDKLTEPQFHAMTRQRIEANVLPKKLFDEGASFLSDLLDGRGERMMELFEETYSQKCACPYSEDDFDFMTLNISDELQLTRISMPSANLCPGIAKAIFIAWNPKEEKMRYFGILKGRKGEADVLMEIESDGRALNHGDAPDEGSELSRIIDVASE